MYEYDTAGNITAKKTYEFSTESLGILLLNYAYTYDNSMWGDLLTGYRGNHIAYDEIGNPIRIGSYNATTDDWYDWYELTWEGRRLVSYQYREANDAYSEAPIYFTYNADGIRTSKTVNGITHQYILDGTQIVAEMWTQDGVGYTLMYDYDENGSPIAIRYRTNSYDFETYDIFFFEKNLQGDIVAVYNANGTKIGMYVYDAWGYCTVVHTTTSTSLEKSILNTYNPFRYRGYYYDVETGFYYLQSRYYNPSWGRFLNADGYVSTGQGLLGYNMFAYCNNNPVMYIDPTGEAWWHWALAGTVVVACAAATVVTCGMSLSGAAMAIRVVASGSAAFTTASTIAAAATIGSGMALGAMAIDAAINSVSVEEFADRGNWGTVAGTGTGMLGGGAYGYNIARTQLSNGSLYNLNGSKNESYISKRGWDGAKINNAIKNGKMGSSINMSNGALCTAYSYPGTDNQYVVIENQSRHVVQVSNLNDPNWIPDQRIIWDP